MSNTQNIFDNEVFFDGYKNLREQDDNLNTLPSTHGAWR